MSHQLTFADSEFSSKRRQTRKEIFLSRMELWGGDRFCTVKNLGENVGKADE